MGPKKVYGCYAPRVEQGRLQGELGSHICQAVCVGRVSRHKHRYLIFQGGMTVTPHTAVADWSSLMTYLRKLR